MKSKRPAEDSGHIIEMQDARQHKRKADKAKYQVNQDVLDQLSGSQKKLTVEVDGYEVPFTNLDKPFWPEHGDSPAFTKRDLAIYFSKVAPYLLPHMKGRPLTLLRFPNGIKGGKFYQKHWEHKLPPFVSTVDHYSEQYKGDEEYMICDNLATLLWLAQIADLELHTWQSRVNPEPDAFQLPTDATGTADKLEASILNYPDFLLFDLDPYIYSGKEAKGDEPELNRAAFRKTCDLANWLREMLEPLDINIYLKTTGKTGLHMYIPLIRNLTFDETRALSEAIGKIVMAKHRDDVTMDWAVVKRTGKVFLDHNMNARGKTLASIYSPRVAPEASVSVPVRWDELYDIYPTDFTISTVHERLAKVGDLWTDILDKKTDLRAIFEKTTDGKPARRSSRRKA